MKLEDLRKALRKSPKRPEAPLRRKRDQIWGECRKCGKRFSARKSLWDMWKAASFSPHCPECSPAHNAMDGDTDEEE